MSLKLAGKKFMVTGAGRGIGRVLSKTLSEQGCKVYAVSRTQDNLETLANENPNIVTIQADVRNWDKFKQKIEDIEVLDGLVNNVAITGETSGSALDVSKEFVLKNFETNVLPSINAIQIIGKKMVAAKTPGSIVNVSSTLSLQGFPHSLAYSTSKVALDMVTKQFALELGPYNIRVNSINPTLVETETMQYVIKNILPLDQIIINRTPMERLPEINEVISPILYLLSDFSSMVSGTTHIVDGGMMSAFLTKF